MMLLGGIPWVGGRRSKLISMRGLILAHNPICDDDCAFSGQLIFPFDVSRGGCHPFNILLCLIFLLIARIRMPRRDLREECRKWCSISADTTAGAAEAVGRRFGCA